MTTARSIRSHESGFKISDLLKTYQDAISISVKLQSRYLWIDSICIVQDSTDDKVRELSHMRSYYESALCVIAASGASSAQNGFLHKSPNVVSENALETHIDAVWNFFQIIEVPFYCPNWERSVILLDPSPDLYEAAEEPLNQRGWTYQERLLCPRVLVFPSTGGHFLQCNKEQRHDDSMDFGVPFDCTRMFAPLSFFPPQEGEDTVTGLHRTWMMHMREYSLRRLTYQEDRPLAIAGVAEESHHRSNGQLGDYVSGHWSRYALISLHWRVFPGEKTDSRRDNNPPSWSWLSIQGQIQLQPFVMATQLDDSLVIVRNLSATPEFAQIPYGKTRHSHLEIEALVGTAMWMPPDRALTPSLKLGNDHDSSSVRTFADTLYDAPRMPVSVFVLPLCLGPRSSLLGLLLKKDSPAEKDFFRRVGYFEFAPICFLSQCKSLCISII